MLITDNSHLQDRLTVNVELKERMWELIIIILQIVHGLVKQVLLLMYAVYSFSKELKLHKMTNQLSIKINCLE